MMRHNKTEKLRATWDIVRGFFRKYAEPMRTVALAALVWLLIVQSITLWNGATITEDTAKKQMQTTETDSSAAAIPIRFAARNEAGLYGIQYNADGLKTAYEDTAEVWAQAIEHAEHMTTADMSAYRRALKDNLLLLDYDSSIPLYAVSSWLGCALPEALTDSTAGTLALTYDGKSYTLYLRDRKNGVLRCAATAVEDTAFEAAIKQYEPNDCSLAAEDENNSISPDLLYFHRAEVLDVISFAAYDGTQGLDELLSAFGLDAQSAQENVYQTGDKSVYVSGENKVRLSEEGTLRYEGTALRTADGGTGTEQQVQCVQTGYELTSAVLEAIGSGASAALTDAYVDRDTGHYITVYGIQLGGVPVDNAQTGYFARCEFMGNVLTRADMALRTAQTTGETIAIMPEKQAAASLSSVDAMLSLRYVDEAAGTTDSSWNQLTQTDNTQTSGATEDGWLDNPDAVDSMDESLQSSWYDTTGTPVSPKWYVLRYGTEEDMPTIGRTMKPEDIVVVQADFDRMIQGGGA